MAKRRFFERQGWRDVKPQKRTKFEEAFNAGITNVVLTTSASVLVSVIAYILLLGPARSDLHKAETGRLQAQINTAKRQANEALKLEADLSDTHNAKNDFIVEAFLARVGKRRNTVRGGSDAMEWMMKDASSIGVANQLLKNPALQTYAAAVLEQTATEEKLLAMIYSHQYFSEKEEVEFEELQMVAFQKQITTKTLSVDLSGLNEDYYRELNFQRDISNANSNDLLRRFTLASAVCFTLLILPFLFIRSSKRPRRKKQARDSRA